MSLSNLNHFPVRDISLKMNANSSIQFTAYIIFVIEFVLLNMFLNRKRIISFFLGFQSQLLSTSDDNQYAKSTNDKDSDSHAKPIDKSAGDHQCCVSKGEVEMVLRSLGLVSSNGGDAKLPARLDADEIFEIFEKKTPSLDEVKEAFDVFDDNRDGFIDEKELQKVLCDLGLKEGSDVERCRRMIGVFDEDGDGRIDFQEFVKFMENSFN